MRTRCRTLDRPMWLRYRPGTARTRSVPPDPDRFPGCRERRRFHQSSNSPVHRGRTPRIRSTHTPDRRPGPHIGRWSHRRFPRRGTRRNRSAPHARYRFLLGRADSSRRRIRVGRCPIRMACKTPQCRRSPARTGSALLWRYRWRRSRTQGTRSTCRVRCRCLPHRVRTRPRHSSQNRCPMGIRCIQPPRPPVHTSPADSGCIRRFRRHRCSSQGRTAGTPGFRPVHRCRDRSARR
jgi:hypothetical protein